jgi:hypothetical protein
MPLFWKPYKSEITQFIEDLKAKKPTLESEQRAGRGLAELASHVGFGRDAFLEPGDPALVAARKQQHAGQQRESASAHRPSV